MMGKRLFGLITILLLLGLCLPVVSSAETTWREKIREKLKQRIDKEQETTDSKSERAKFVFRGMDYHEMTYDNMQRSYGEYVPAENKEKEGKYPLVIVLHGGGGTGKYMAALTGFNRLAEQEKFIVVYPDGIERRWNDGRNFQEYKSQRENIDDVGFISALIDQLATQYPVDLERVYVTGVSNGAMMTHRLAVDLSTRIAAAAMVDGNIPENYFSKGIPSKPVPIIIMNGTKDQLMPWEGGEIGLEEKSKGRVVSTEQTVNFWLKHNKCEVPGQMIYKPDRDPNDGTTVRIHSYKNKDNEVMVVLYAIEGGGHTWPGASEDIPQAPRGFPKTAIGLTCFDINGTEEIYNFFKQYSRKREMTK
ncbi:MAG: PHB depolymerase family esterase [Candidatus Omnitrophica bacterium]|nr:PHB depolymerase family esterase [Candidatus Omnitrophota bacterium]